MSMDSKARVVRAALAWALLLGLVGAIILWVVSPDPIPKEITLVTGEKDGLYHQFGLALKEIYERRTGYSLLVRTSAGSAANQDSLLEKEAELAVVQAGSVELVDVDLYCPLFPEVVHVVVREGRGIEDLQQLNGRQLVLGKLESGMRRSAVEILEHHQLMSSIVEVTNGYFSELLSNEALDGAVVTTGIFNKALLNVLESRRFRLLPLRAAGAIDERNGHLYEYTVPMGLYGMPDPIPPTDLPTVATTALLVGQKDLPAKLIRELLESVYDGELHYRFPTLFRKGELEGLGPGPLAREAELYFNPADRIGQVANIMESVAAFKEVAFAICAGLYLVWGRFRRFEEKEKARFLQREKDRLDELLIDTLRIEEAQVAVSDPEQLRKMMDEVTRIKLNALRQLTHEGLRGDRVFMIFLTQCANLIGKIQAKIDRAESGDERGRVGQGLE